MAFAFLFWSKRVVKKAKICKEISSSVIRGSNEFVRQFLTVFHHFLI
jgi:hypothetical protein